MNFDEACEKIQNCVIISCVEDIIKKTNKQDKDAVKDMARAWGYQV